MSTAHRFIAAARADPELRSHIAALGPDPHIDALVALGAAAGFAFDAAALRAAWRQDYALLALAKGSGRG